MTWEQFVAVLLGIAATALVRLLDRYLPPSGDHPAAAAVVAGTIEATAGPAAVGPPVIGGPTTPEEEPPPPPPPEPDHGPPTAI